MAAQRLTRTEKQARTRSAILRAAATLFARHGVEGTSVEAIARHAGLTQGAIYSNFASKAELWWAVVEQMSRTLAFEEFFRGEASLTDELREFGRAAWSILQGASRTQLLLTQEFELFLMRNPRPRATYARDVLERVRDMADLLDRGAAQRGQPLPMDPQRLARLIDAVAHGLMHSFMLDHEAVDETLCVDALVALAESRGEPRG
jgi:AcrR family transcriptional regulator